MSSNKRGEESGVTCSEGGKMEEDEWLRVLETKRINVPLVPPSALRRHARRPALKIDTLNRSHHIIPFSSSPFLSLEGFKHLTIYIHITLRS